MQTLSKEEMIETNGGTIIGALYVIGAGVLIYKMATAKTFRINIAGFGASWSN